MANGTGHQTPKLGKPTQQLSLDSSQNKDANWGRRPSQEKVESEPEIFGSAISLDDNADNIFSNS